MALKCKNVRYVVFMILQGSVDTQTVSDGLTIIYPLVANFLQCISTIMINFF